jgi:PAS domain S-box-containing protein
MTQHDKPILHDRDSLYASNNEPTTKTQHAIRAQSIILKERQTAALYRAMPSSMILSSVGMFLTFIMLYQTDDATRGVVWLALAAGVVLYRVLVYWQYSHHAEPHPDLMVGNNSHLSEINKPLNADFWIRLAFVGNILAGTLFGLLGTWLYVADPIYRALFSLIVIMGYVGGSVVPYASVRYAHAAFAIPACVPPIIYLFFMRNDGNIVAGAIAIFMFGAIMYMAEKQYRTIRARILSELENEQHRREASDENTTLGMSLQKLEHRAEVVKRAQFESRRRVATLVQHMETTLLPVLECDHFGRIIEWNHAAEATFGYRHSDLAVTTISDLVSATDKNIEWKSFYDGMLNRKKPASIDVFMRAFDGQRYPVKLYLTPIDIDGKADAKAMRAAIIITNIPSEIAKRRAEKYSA